jgi:hypothetical protein
MPIAKKLIFLSFVILSFSAKLQGQAVRSPFTTYGIGDLYNNGLVQNQGMGGIGVAIPNYFHINNQNPALLTFNTVTSFQAGVIGESRTIKSDTSKEKNQGANMNYLVTAFPIIPKGLNNSRWSSSVGLMPLSTVNYSFSYPDYSRDENGIIKDTVDVIETGSGGLNQFYWSNGVQLLKNLSVGLKAAYIFGPIEKSYSNTLNQSGASPYLIEVKDKIQVKDFLFTLGAVFTDTLNKKYGYHLGGTYTIGGKMKTSRRGEIQRTLPGSPTPLSRDTLFTSGGNITIPSSFTVGFSFFRKDFWIIGTEFTAQNWSTYESIYNDDEGLANSWRGSIGGEVTPNLASENFLKRLTYRAGFSYENYPFVVNGNQVKDFGINFGFSVPTGNAKNSRLDFAVKAGKRGNKKENILEESYFKIYFGITFNDQWFIKRKFD